MACFYFRVPFILIDADLTHQTPLRPTHRDAELDGLRGLAVGMVLAWHFIGIPAWSTNGWLPYALFRVFLFGGAGVDLFFVLSGFLITRIIISRTQSDTRFLLAFYARRALRILPPYLLLAGIFWAVVWAGVHNEVFNDDIPIWRLLTFSQNYWMAEHATYGPGGISVTWSVAIEEQYYLAFPLLVLLLPRRRLPHYLVVVAIVSVLWRAFIFAMNPANDFPYYVGTLARLDGLAAGGVIACAFDDSRWRAWLHDHKNGIWRAMIWSLVLLPLVRRDMGMAMAYYGHTVLTVCFALLTVNILLNLGSNARWMRYLRAPTLRFLGRISYSLYLFHPLVLATIFLISGYSKSLSGWPEISLLVASLAVSIYFSNLLFSRFERRLIGFGRQIPY